MPIATYLILPWFADCGNSAFTNGRSDGVFLTKIFIPAQITVSAIVAMASTAVSGDHWGIGLYDDDGILVLDSGPIAMSTSGSNELLVASISPVLVPQGSYWLAATSDSATASLVGSEMTFNANDITCKGTTAVATATNNSSGGQLPSTTGTIIAASVPLADQFSPYVKLQA